jgi:hypothetical protein
MQMEVLNLWKGIVGMHYQKSPLRDWTGRRDPATFKQIVEAVSACDNRQQIDFFAILGA